MRSIRKWFTPMLLAATLGLGAGLGSAGDAHASAACRQQCAADFQACLAASDNGYPGFYRCRQEFSACLRTCS